MKICDLSSGAGQLTRAANKLRERWADTKNHWNDENSRQLEEHHLQPLVPQIQMTLAALQRLAEVLERAERECEDHDVR